MVKFLFNNLHLCFLGQVKKCGMLKIIHEKYKHNNQKMDQVMREYVSSFDEAIEHNKEIDGLINKTKVCNMQLDLSFDLIMKTHLNDCCKKTNSQRSILSSNITI